MTVIISGTDGVTASGGLYSQTAFTGTYTDGVVVDYTTGTGRITVGSADGLKIRNGGTGSPVDLVTVDSSGNVGIGTSSPSAKLNVTAAYSADTTPQITFLESGGGIGTAMFFGLKSDGTRWIMSKDGSTSTAYPMAFYTGTSERMRIDSSGNLSVGVTTATNTPNNGVSMLNATSSTQVGIGHSSGTAGGTGYILFNYNGGAIGSITQNGTTATAYNTSSDYRLKNTVEPMTGALATVAALQPVTYKWNADGSDGQGFIAHELQAVVPDCVTGEKDAVDVDGNPVYQGIDTSFLVATLTAAIKEQQAIITQLQADVVDLSSQIAALKA